MNVGRRRLARLATFVAATAATATWLDAPHAYAAPCAALGVTRPVYGAGGSAVTPTLRNVAVALAGLPEAERVTVLYADPGACTGYAYWRAPDPTLEVSFRYWSADGLEQTCEAPQSVVQFAHMGNTPALCPGDVPVPEGAKRFVAPVQSVNFITHFNSQFNEISAEALYHIYGFGPGAAGRAVSPWVVTEAVTGRNTSSFVHQVIAASIRVPAAAFQVLPTNVIATNGDTVRAVYNWGLTADADQPLGYVSGSNAAAGEDAQQVKTLAYQHFDQTCAYLPDSSRVKRDKRNVRSGQYWLWTPAWFYARVGADGEPADATVANLIGWFDGSRTPPGGLDVQKLVVESGDVPLCAMNAIRPDGDLGAIQSYAPPSPCNGWYDFVATGESSRAACSDDTSCQGEGQKCRRGFCEDY